MAIGDSKVVGNINTLVATATVDYLETNPESFVGPQGPEGPEGVGKGFTGGVYDPTSGKVTFASDDGIGFSTDDIRGEKGDKGDKGDTGIGWAGPTGPKGDEGDPGKGITKVTQHKVGSINTITMVGDFDNAPFQFQVADGSAGVDVMYTNIYDTTVNGIVDNAEKVNGLTVETAVPIDAVFTDTTYVVGDGGLTEVNFTATKDTQLSNTESSTQLDARDTANRNADNHTDGTTNGVYTLAERTKLAGVETAATADQTDAEIKVAYDNEYVQRTTSSYINTATNIDEAADLLDIQAKVESDARVLADDTIEASVGLATDGTYVARTGSNYLDAATSVVDEISKLDVQAKTNEDAITSNDTDIAGVVQSILNLSKSTAKGQFGDNGSMRVELDNTYKVLPVEIKVQSTDTDKFEINADGSITVKEPGEYSFISTVTFEDMGANGDIGNVTFQIMDTTNDTVYYNESASIEVSNYDRETIPFNSLVVADDTITYPVTANIRATVSGVANGAYDIIGLSSVVVATSSTGTITQEHNELVGRDAAGSHPISAITGLQSALDGKLASETLTTLTMNANILTYTDENGVVTNHDLSLYLDDTNLARLTSGVVNPTTGIATFTRDDASTFDVDFSALLGATIIVNDTLTSTSTTSALSANQGNVLNSTKANIADVYTKTQSDALYEPANANILLAGDNVSQLVNDAGYTTGNDTITLSGDAAGSGTNSIVVTLNSDVVKAPSGILPVLDGSNLTGISTVGSINDLTDVDTTGVVSGQVLKYDGTKFIASNDLEGTGTGSVDLVIDGGDSTSVNDGTNIVIDGGTA